MLILDLNVSLILNKDIKFVMCTAMFTAGIVKKYTQTSYKNTIMANSLSH